MVAPQPVNTQIFTPQQTQEAVNMARAQAAQMGDLGSYLEQYGRGGMAATSPYMQSRILAEKTAPAYAQSAAAGVQIPWQHAQANAQSLSDWQQQALQGSMGAAQSQLSLQGGLQQNQLAQQQGLYNQQLAGLQYQQSLLGLLSQFF